jgi:hypothetical protein
VNLKMGLDLKSLLIPDRNALNLIRRCSRRSSLLKASAAPGTAYAVGGNNSPTVERSLTGNHPGWGSCEAAPSCIAPSIILGHAIHTSNILSNSGGCFITASDEPPILLLKSLTSS